MVKERRKKYLPFLIFILSILSILSILWTYLELWSIPTHGQIFGIFFWLIIYLPLIILFFLLISYKKIWNGFKWQFSKLALIASIIVMLALIPGFGLVFTLLAIIFGYVLLFKEKNYLGIIVIILGVIIRLLEILLFLLLVRFRIF